MAYDYRAQAYTFAGAGYEKLVDAAAANLHYNESLHLHNLGNEKQQHGACGYCWLRAGRAVQALAAIGAVSAEQTTDAVMGAR